MKKFLFVIFIFALAQFAFAGPSKDTADPDTAGLTVREPARAARPDTQTAVTQGTARGRIVIYTSMYEDIFDGIERAMEKHFPNLDVVFVYGGTGAVQSRVASEIAAGRLGCDILMVAEPSYSMELKEKGVLHPFRSRHAANLAFEYDREGYWYPVRILNMVFAFNPARYKRDEVAQSFYEFAFSPDQRGAVSMPDPRTSGTAMVTVTALWDRYGERYIERLGYQRTQVEPTSAALSKLEKGQLRVAMVLEETILKMRQEGGSNLEVIYPADGAVVIPSTIAIINDKWSANKNTAAATAIAEWFLSEEGQGVIVSGWMHSARRNFNRFPQGSKPIAQIITGPDGQTMPVVWENAYRERELVHGKFRQYLGRR